MESLTEPQIAKIAFQIAQGLDYLHSQGIAHCDLKLSNLLTHNGEIVNLIKHRKSVISGSVEGLMNHLLEMFAGPSSIWPPK
jgi:tRNA A-37 threonylcarbamoyl transferase component Bud32